MVVFKTGALNESLANKPNIVIFGLGGRLKYFTYFVKKSSLDFFEIILKNVEIFNALSKLRKRSDI